MDNRQAELHNATVQAKKIVLNVARLRPSGQNLGIETGRRHLGLPRNERSCHSCKGLLGEDFVAPIDDEEGLLFSY
jgi:hypothetical protein